MIQNGKEIDWKMDDLIIPKIWEGKEICICVTDERAVFIYDKEQDRFIDTRKTAIELPTHGRLVDADELLASDAIDWGEEAWNGIRDAATVLERTT